MVRRAEERSCGRTIPRRAQFLDRRMALLMLSVVGLSLWGCQSTGRPSAGPTLHAPARTFVLPPVINLSGSQDFDALKVTDLFASELLSFPGVTVIPVNLTLAALARNGKSRVETPAEAVALANEFGADATLVVAITEYDPYDPPVIGLIMQWYPATGGGGPITQVEVAADATPIAPRYQVQRVFNAADKDVVRDLRHFAKQRDHDTSPYGWKRYKQTQELYLRYCGTALFRTIITQNGLCPAAAELGEAES
jgi:hypothetical protein